MYCLMVLEAGVPQQVSARLAPSEAVRENVPFFCPASGVCGHLGGLWLVGHVVHSLRVSVFSEAWLLMRTLVTLD